jgi:hypothetical protein
MMMTSLWDTIFSVIGRRGREFSTTGIVQKGEHSFTHDLLFFSCHDLCWDRQGEDVLSFVWRDTREINGNKFQWWRLLIKRALSLSLSLSASKNKMKEIDWHGSWEEESFNCCMNFLIPPSLSMKWKLDSRNLFLNVTSRHIPNNHTLRFQMSLRKWVTFSACVSTVYLRHSVILGECTEASN